MDGVYIHDFLADSPQSFRDPISYSIKYYAQYPALGIPFYYPPLFAFVEAGLFAVFGVSVFTARLTVVVFAVLAVVMLHKLVSRVAGPRAGFLSAALFISLPIVVFWSRQVMLELPAAAMILTACWFFFRYIELEHRSSALWTGLFTTAAVMTKQPALFIVPAFGLYILIRRRWECFRQWQFWLGSAFTCAVLLPYFIFTYRYAHFLTSAGDSGIKRGILSTLRDVFASWSQALSLPLLIAIIVAAVALLLWEAVRPKYPAVRLFALLALMFLAESVYLYIALPRYPIIAFPIIVSFLPILLARTKLLDHRASYVTIVIAVLSLSVYSFLEPPTACHGYEEATQAMLEENESSRFLLFDGFRDGDIVFFVRQHDPQRQRYVLRGSKMLYTYASFKEYGYNEYVTSPEELSQFIREHGIEVIAVEDRNLSGVAPADLLRDNLSKTDRFMLTRTCPIAYEKTHLDGLNVLVYQTTDPPLPATAETLNIPLAGLRRMLEVPINGSIPPRLVVTPWNEP